MEVEPWDEFASLQYAFASSIAVDVAKTQASRASSVDWPVGAEGNHIAPRLAREDPVSATPAAHNDDNTVAARKMEWPVGTKGNRKAPRQTIMTKV